MKSLHHKVNIVPVIAKADMLTPVELSKLKKKASTRLFLYIKIFCGKNDMVVITVSLSTVIVNNLYVTKFSTSSAISALT